MVAGGTYVYCETSQNNKLQKELYNMHKYRHLIKPFVVCTTNGLIVDVFGTYSAKDNDANILMSILKDSDLKNLLQPKHIHSFLEWRHLQMNNRLFYKQIKLDL